MKCLIICSAGIPTTPPRSYTIITAIITNWSPSYPRWRLAVTNNIILYKIETFGFAPTMPL
jgi:hypothetical protein